MKPIGTYFDETQRKRRGRERWGRKGVKKVICSEEEERVGKKMGEESDLGEESDMRVRK
jgi:hypothetical protein